jgi:hypothetical protein
MINFVVVDIEAPFNTILGRTWLGAMKAVSSTFHQKLKFVCDEGVVTVRGSQSSARECFKGVVGPTLTEKRPEAIGDADTRLAEAAKFNQTLLLSEEGKSNSYKRKSEDPAASQNSKQKAGQ